MNCPLPNQVSRQAPALQPGTHLSDLQIDDHLIGDLPPEAAAHLASCALCSDRIAAAAAPLASFQTLTLAWSERRSATLPLPSLSRRKPFWHCQAAWITACLALVLGITLTSRSRNAALQTDAQNAIPKIEQHDSSLQAPIEHAGLQPVSIRSMRPRPPHMRRAASPAPLEIASLILPPREQQISADNRMLRAISDEFGIPATIPSTLGLTNVSGPLPQSSRVRSLQD